MAYATIIRDGTNTPRTLTALVIRDGTNTPRTIQQLWVRDPSNVPRLVYSTTPPMSAAASPADVSGGSLGSGTITTNVTSVTPTGGTGPYTYAWTLLIHTSGTLPTATAPTGAATAFTQTGISPGDDEYATWRCTVTDSLAATATTDVNATWIDFS